jgi:hypothetical protein
MATTRRLAVCSNGWDKNAAGTDDGLCEGEPDPRSRSAHFEEMPNNNDIKIPSRDSSSNVACLADRCSCRRWREAHEGWSMALPSSCLIATHKIF